MAEKPLYIAFLWHMHQPLYKNGSTGKYLLPWVRMHGIKDYYDMAKILEKYPNIHQTFNLTPVLITQIEDYINNKATDTFLDLTMKKANDLTEEDKSFLLYNFFMANWDNMVNKYPRYKELLVKRGLHITQAEIENVKSRFSKQDYLDLQVLFNLAWFDPMFLQDEPLSSLVKKGCFTEEDKKMIIDKQLEVLSMIIPEYKKLQDTGQIEVITSPFYHPILPLIYNTDIARISSPHIPLPKKRFYAPIDAQRQIEEAIKFYKERFNRLPDGMWPPEGSVCEEIIPMIEESGIKWIVTDEDILASSIGKPILKDTRGNVLNPGILYKPYRFQWSRHYIDFLFRDHTISDLIGFSYAKWRTEDAIQDFIKRLEVIWEKIKNIPGDYIVSIILDGENAWEYYPNDGRDFLCGIYERLNSHPFLKCVTISEFLRGRMVMDILPGLFPGSWINRNFDIWIGDEEENTAWDYLMQAREALSKYEGGLDHPLLPEQAQAISKAWQEIYAAEGSDWNWWYGDQHTSGYDEAFDYLYRGHLSNVYSLIGKEPPTYLKVPITLPVKARPPVTMPVDFIRPVLDGIVTNYYEWLASGFYDIRKTGGTMHQAQSIVKAIYYGFDMKNLYFRVDFNIDLSDPVEAEEISLNIDIISPFSGRIKVLPGDKQLIFSYEGEEKKIGALAVKKIMEMSVPITELNLKPKDELKFIFIVLRYDREMERWPTRAPITLTIPSPDYHLENWYV